MEEDADVPSPPWQVLDVDPLVVEKVRRLLTMDDAALMRPDHYMSPDGHYFSPQPRDGWIPMYPGGGMLITNGDLSVPFTHAEVYLGTGWTFTYSMFRSSTILRPISRNARHRWYWHRTASTAEDRRQALRRAEKALGKVQFDFMRVNCITTSWWVAAQRQPEETFGDAVAARALLSTALGIVILLFSLVAVL